MGKFKYQPKIDPCRGGVSITGMVGSPCSGMVGLVCTGIYNHNAEDMQNWVCLIYSYPK